MWILLLLLNFAYANFQVNIQGAGTFYVPAPIVYNLQDGAIEFSSLLCEKKEPLISGDSFEDATSFRTINGIKHPFKSFVYHPGNMSIDIVPWYPVNCIRPY